MGEIPFEGTLKIGHNVKIGYFAQNQAQLLDGELTVFDTIDRVAVGDIRTKIRDILGAFMFGGEASDKKVKVLSGGEKTRLAMIKMLLEPVNLLILDEPTNHLDMRTKDILKSAIKDFNGTVIVVSHDREFLDGLVEKVYEFGGGKVREHLGGIYDFLEYKKIESLRQLEMSQPQGNVVTKEKANASLKMKKTAKESSVESQVKSSKISYFEQKEKAKEIKRLQKKVASYEEEIDAIGKQIKEIEASLASGENLPADIYEQHSTLNKKMENVMSMWEMAYNELEELTKESI